MQTTRINAFSNTFSMTIGGRGASAQETFEVVDPSTGETFEWAPACSPVQLDDAMEAASLAFLSWRQDASNRRLVLTACAAAVQARAQELVGILTRTWSREGSGRAAWPRL